MPRLTLQNVENHSFFIKRSLVAMDYSSDEAARLARLTQLASAPFTRERMKALLDPVTDPEALAAAMRRLRRDVMVSAAARDMTGVGGYGEVVQTMTTLAEETVSAAVRVHSWDLARRYGVPMSSEGVPQDMMVVGMGKLGGGELNASSDIDLIFGNH